MGVQSSVHNLEIPWYRPDDDIEWWCQIKMGIRETRMLHNSIVNYLDNYPEGRHEEEKGFLIYHKNKLFAMMMEYNYSHSYDTK